MAVRLVGRTPATCPGKVGRGSDNACEFSLEEARKILFKKQNGANPFLTEADIVDETVWDTLLALTDADDPDNVLLSPPIYNSVRTAGEPNIVESEGTGRKQVTHYGDSMFAVDWSRLSEEAANELMATLRDSSSNLEFIYINIKGQIIAAYNSVTVAEVTTITPLWIPLNLTTMNARGKEGGRGSLEMHKAQLHIYEGDDVNWKAWKPTWNALAKTQS